MLTLGSARSLPELPKESAVKDRGWPRFQEIAAEGDNYVCLVELIGWKLVAPIDDFGGGTPRGIVEQ